MQCAQCHSDNVQKLSVIYQSGTQTINTTSRTFGSGVGFGGGGLLGVGSASTRTTGQQQSHLAGIAAPPKKRSYSAPVIIITMSIISMMAGWMSGAFFLLPLALSAFLVYRAFAYNKNQWPPKYQHWSKSWHCNKCGVIYTA